MVFAVPQNNERLAELKQQRSDLISQMVDLCMNSKSSKVVESCDKESIPSIIEDCKKEHLEACDDPRLSNYFSLRAEQNTMSEECKEAKEIMDKNRWAANNGDYSASTEYGLAMNDYNRFGCP